MSAGMQWMLIGAQLVMLACQVVMYRSMKRMLSGFLTCSEKKKAQRWRAGLSDQDRPAKLFWDAGLEKPENRRVARRGLLVKFQIAPSQRRYRHGARRPKRGRP